MDMYQKREMRKNKKMNEDTKSLPSTSINWYPGHMAKARREMKENMNLIDVVYEVVDARIPISSQNPDMRELTKNKKKIIILNKSDLADEKETSKWIQKFKSKNSSAISACSNSGEGIAKVQKAIEEIMQDEMRAYEEKGRKGESKTAKFAIICTH